MTTDTDRLDRVEQQLDNIASADALKTALPQPPLLSALAQETLARQERARQERVRAAELVAEHETKWREKNADLIVRLDGRLEEIRDELQATYRDEQDFADRMAARRGELVTERDGLARQLVPPAPTPSLLRRLVEGVRG